MTHYDLAFTTQALSLLVAGVPVDPARNLAAFTRARTALVLRIPLTGLATFATASPRSIDAGVVFALASLARGPAHDCAQLVREACGASHIFGIVSSCSDGASRSGHRRGSHDNESAHRHCTKCGYRDGHGDLVINENCKREWGCV